jgi:hypothetical protein
MWGHEVSLEKHYKGFRLYGRADSLDNYTDHWRAAPAVYVDMPDNSLKPVDTLSDLDFTFDDEHLAACCALFLAELTVDHFALPRDYYLLPMSTPWAVNILCRGAEEFLRREIQRP